MTAWSAAFAGLGVIIAASTVVWTVSLAKRDASIADICWGPGFVLLSWLYLILVRAFEPRPILVASLVTVWGLRLGIHLARRHRGEDPRYTSMRRAHGPAFWWRSLFVVFWLQAGILWFVALPVLAVARGPQPGGITAADVAGVIFFAVGLAFEAIGDWQLARFRSEPANRGKVLDRGLWRYTRHPNYFGDAVLWWGIFGIGLSTPLGWMTVMSPLVMTWLLVRISGVALLEERLKASKPGYADYVERTSSFVPWPPRR